MAADGYAVSAAGLQGLLLGRASAGAGFDGTAWLAEARQALGNEPDEAVSKALLGLLEMVRQELTGDGVAVTLLLPGDEAPLTERVQAVAQWSQGFLEGFGIALGNRPLSQDAREALQDLTAIAQIQQPDGESEQAENDYTQVVEYLKLVPTLLFSEFAAPRQGAAGDAMALDGPVQGHA